MLQRTLPYEVLIADDGSGADTEKTIGQFKSRAFFHVEHLWQKHDGFRAARIRNQAIKKARGEYIIFLDGDCVPERHFIDDHLCLAEEGFFFQGKRVLLNRNASNRFEPAQGRAMMLRLLAGGGVKNAHHMIRMPFWPSSWDASLKGIKTCNMGMYVKDLLAVNGFNEGFVGWGREDSELAARLFKFGLMRKKHPFMAACFHLWHEEVSRDRLAINDSILQQTIAGSEYRCKDGIFKIPDTADPGNK